MSMETKTIEEMKAAIKDYCREACPNIGSVILEPKHIHVKKYDDEEWGILFPYAVGWVGVSSMGEGDAAFLYAALGLSERDAVAAERERLTRIPKQTYDEFKANLAKSVKDDDFPMADMYVQCLQVQLLSAYTDLQARNTALVAALEETKRYCESGAGRGGATLVGNEWINEGKGTLYDSVLTALTANTEKGGDHA